MHIDVLSPTWSLSATLAAPKPLRAEPAPSSPPHACLRPCPALPLHWPVAPGTVGDCGNKCVAGDSSLLAAPPGRSSVRHPASKSGLARHSSPRRCANKVGSVTLARTEVCRTRHVLQQVDAAVNVIKHLIVVGLIERLACLK